MKSDKLVKKIFSVDNRFVRFCERVLDLLTLNILFVLTCLPIITVGIAKMSLYQVLLRMKEEQHIAVFPAYLSAVKENSKRGFFLGLGEVAIVLFCLLDMRILGQVENNVSLGMRLVCIAILFLTVMTSFYLYPLALREPSTNLQLVKKAFFLTCLNFPWSFLMIGILGVLFILLYSSLLAFLLGMSLLFLIGFSAMGYVYVSFMERLLEKYLYLSIRLEK